MIDQPSSNITLPEELQKAIEDARTNLYNLEMKSGIQSKANASMQKDNDTLLKQQEYLTSQIVVLKEQESDLKTSIETITTLKNEIESSVISLRTEIIEKTSKQSILEIQYQDNLSTLKKEKEDLANSRMQFHTERNDFIEEKESFNQKIQNLKNIMTDF